jgi:predicted nuclease of restriction endonuclease-like RecB superfamily
MVNVTTPMRLQRRNSLVEEPYITTKESPNYFCENPTILVAELMENLNIKNIQTSYFSAPEPAFSGVDMYNCLKRVKGFGVENENLVEQMCSF